jgi:hypothetical protein
MTTIELARLVRDMRAEQRAYFLTKKTDLLISSKRKEKTVDDAIREILSDRLETLPGFEDIK